MMSFSFRISWTCFKISMWSFVCRMIYSLNVKLGESNFSLVLKPAIFQQNTTPKWNRLRKRFLVELNHRPNIVTNGNYFLGIILCRVVFLNCKKSGVGSDKMPREALFAPEHFGNSPLYISAYLIRIEIIYYIYICKFIDIQLE
jgi:hypothetical protein